ncbi:MAG: amidohydrolase family protein [Microbacteriaceae bacterium]
MSDSSAADLVLRGGVVRVLDEAGTRGTAIAIAGGRVLATGDDAAVSRLVGPATRVVELAGRAVLPGINDSHLHAAWVGGTWPRFFFGAASGEQPSLDTVLARDDEERRALLLRFSDLAASFGITSYTEPGIGPGEDSGATGAMGTATLRVYRDLAGRGLLKQRVNLLMLFGIIDGPAAVEAVVAGISGYDRSTPDERRFRVAGLKVFGDGVPIARGSFIHSHYADGSHGHLSPIGRDEPAQIEALRAMVLAGHRAGLQVGVHATGDRTVDAVISAVREGLAERPGDPRHYIIHGDLATPAQLEEMAALGMGVTYQIGIGVATRDAVAPLLGRERTAAGWAIRYAWDHGVKAALSSDAPFLSLDWRREIANADTWLGPAGDPEARMLELLRAYTAVPAWIDHAEDWKGTLEPGKVADLVVLAGDPFELTPAEIPGLGVAATYLDGELVYDAACGSGAGGSGDPVTQARS